MKIKQTFFKLIMPAVKLYWHIFKPESHGARVLIIHPTEKGKVLLVRHSYGNTALWNIPGGGYNPKKETAATAATREVLEELGVKVIDLQELGEYNTSGEGKKDTVIMFSCTLEDTGGIRLNPEISQLSWVDIQTIPDRGNDVARVARRAVEKIL
jgi:ADP-ribose pyrophosphatase YjhB (NUDIX family)